MAQNFIACDREQELLLPPSLREWLPEEHLAWFVFDAVGEMDLAAFYAAYRDDGHGRAAHDPAMMVALLRLRLRDRGAVLAGDRAALPRRRRLPRDHGQPGARSRDDRALSRAPRGGDRRAVRRGAGAVRAQAVWSRSASSRSTARRSRRRRRITRRAAMSRSRARSSKRRRASTPPRTSSMATRAAMSCREGLRTSGDRRKRLREAKQALDAERAARGQAGPARPRRAAARVPAPAEQD